MRLPPAELVWLTIGLRPVGHRDEAWLRKGLPARIVPTSPSHGSSTGGSSHAAGRLGVDPRKLSATIEVVDHPTAARVRSVHHCMAGDADAQVVAAGPAGLGGRGQHGAAGRSPSASLKTANE